MAAALLRILGESGIPLHLRFEVSLWNALCQLFGDRQGYEPEILQKEREGHYCLSTVTHKHLFAVEAKNGEAQSRLQVLMERRVPDTEETSLKFSGLSQEELNLWREGRPSSALRYELSFWSDLAKWLMLLQEGAPYELHFGYTEEGLPNRVEADLSELQVEFYLSQANLPAIIPTFPLRLPREEYACC